MLRLRQPIRTASGRRRSSSPLCSAARSPRHAIASRSRFRPPVRRSRKAPTAVEQSPVERVEEAEEEAVAAAATDDEPVEVETAEARTASHTAAVAAAGAAGPDRREERTAPKGPRPATGPSRKPKSSDRLSALPLMHAVNPLPKDAQLAKAPGERANLVKIGSVAAAALLLVGTYGRALSLRAGQRR